jgi:hypothetical protein
VITADIGNENHTPFKPYKIAISSMIGTKNRRYLHKDSIRDIFGLPID